VEHGEALSDRLADFGKTIRAAILVSDELGDADKYRWFLGAHSHSKR